MNKSIFLAGILFFLACLFLAQCRQLDEGSSRVQTSLDLIDIFPEALEQGGSVSLQEMFLKGGIRSIISTAAGDFVTFRVDLHEGAFLTFEWGIKAEETGGVNRAGKGNILVQVTGKNKRATLFKKNLTPESVMSLDRWQREKISLKSYSGQRVHLTFSMIGEAPWTCGWANPMICSRGKNPPSIASPAGPNIVLVSVDTLRADHLHCYGYPIETSPAIDRLAAEGVLFEQAYAQAYWTLPSHMSLLTSLYPDVHRVPSRNVEALAENIPTLASVLKDRGYLTGGFAKDCGYMSPSYGFDTGFDQYSMRHQDAEGYNRRIENWLENAAGKKFFLFLHLFDPHSDTYMLPYDGPKAYIQEYAAAVPADFTGCRNGRCASLFLKSVNEGESLIKPEEVEYLKQLYDVGIRSADDHLDFLMQTLEKLGLKDNTILVFSSDHGEEFMEHGKLLHSQFYEELIHVPLIFYYPGGNLPGGNRIQALAQNIDIMPTLLDLLGIDYEGHLQGTSLMAYLEGGAPPGKVIYGAGPGINRQTVRSGPWKLMIHEDHKTELFNLLEDPNEKNNRKDRDKDIHDRLLKIAGSIREDNAALREKLISGLPEKEKEKIKPVLSDAEKNNLRALGYLH